MMRDLSHASFDFRRFYVTDEEIHTLGFDQVIYFIHTPTRSFNFFLSRLMQKPIKWESQTNGFQLYSHN